MYIYLCVSRYIYIYTYIHIYIYIFVYIYIFTYIYIHIQMKAVLNKNFSKTKRKPFLKRLNPLPLALLALYIIFSFFIAGYLPIVLRHLGFQVQSNHPGTGENIEW